MHNLLCHVPAILQQEREAFLDEISTERRRLAEEHASINRRSEEARATLLELKGLVAEYEATAAAALRQAKEEQGKAAVAREAARKYHEEVADSKRELQVGCTRSTLLVWLL